MRKKKKKIKKKMLRFRFVLLIVSSIMAGHAIVAFSDVAAHLESETSQLRELSAATERIALSFEEYNQKRFER